MTDEDSRDAQIFWGHFGDISATPQTTAKNLIQKPYHTIYASCDAPAIKTGPKTIQPSHFM